MRVTHLLLSFTAAALPMAVVPAAAASAAVGPVGPVGPVHCHVWFPPSWTRVQGSAGLDRGGLRIAEDRQWATDMSRRHELFVVADNSGRTSPNHDWTVATLDCLTRNSSLSREALRASLRHDLQRRGAKTVTLADTTISGRPAELATWNGGTHMGIRIKTVGAYPSTFDLTTDRMSYMHDAKRIIRTLRF